MPCVEYVLVVTLSLKLLKMIKYHASYVEMKFGIDLCSCSICDNQWVLVEMVGGFMLVRACWSVVCMWFSFLKIVVKLDWTWWWYPVAAALNCPEMFQARVLFVYVDATCVPLPCCCVFMLGIYFHDDELAWNSMMLLFSNLCHAQNSLGYVGFAVSWWGFMAMIMC
jgi:hypothetical protein